MKSALDARINELKPGRSIEISRGTTGFCTAERSGKGDTLRFVRHIGNVTTVFKTMKWSRV